MNPRRAPAWDRRELGLRGHLPVAPSVASFCTGDAARRPYVVALWGWSNKVEFCQEKK